MTWAEPFALGELGLMPEQFWTLTVREFWMKHEAFRRAEDRQESLMLRHAMRTTKYKTGDRRRMERDANALRRYPVKPWIMQGD